MTVEIQPKYNTGKERHFHICHSFDVFAPAKEESKVACHPGWELTCTPNLTHFTSQTMRIRGQNFTSSPSNFLFYNSLEEHIEIYPSNTPSRSLSLVLDHVYLTNLLMEVGIAPNEVVFDQVSYAFSERLKDSFSTLFSLRKNRYSSSLLFDCILTDILMELLIGHRNSASKKLKREMSKGKYPSNIARAKKVISHNITNPDFSLDDLAQQSGVSKFHLARLFKNQVGMSPIQYLNHLKIELAMGRLKAEQVKVSELAIDLGFHSFSAFNKSFRKQTGLSPRAFRKDSIVDNSY